MSTLHIYNDHCRHQQATLVIQKKVREHLTQEIIELGADLEKRTQLSGLIRSNQIQWDMLKLNTEPLSDTDTFLSLVDLVRQPTMAPTLIKKTFDATRWHARD